MTEFKKFQVARRLGENLERVRDKYSRDLHGENETSQCALVAQLIDSTCIRIGNETGEETSTRGACTLQVENLDLEQSRLRFVGKSHVAWDIPITAALTHDLAALTHGLPSNAQIFSVNAARVNRYLGTLMPGLTAKVFRTHHATQAVKAYLNASDIQSDDPYYYKDFIARAANLEAAKLLYHKRTLTDRHLAHITKLERGQFKNDRSRYAYDLARMQKDFALGTSLRNYIDPRVYTAWSNETDYDLRIYSLDLRRKFKFAF